MRRGGSQDEQGLTTEIGQFCDRVMSGSTTPVSASTDTTPLRIPGARACTAVVAADQDEIKNIDPSISIDVASRIRARGGQASGNGDQVEEVHRAVGIDIARSKGDIW